MGVGGSVCGLGVGVCVCVRVRGCFAVCGWFALCLALAGLDLLICMTGCWFREAEK